MEAYKFKKGDKVRVVGPFRTASPTPNELEGVVGDVFVGNFSGEPPYSGTCYEVCGWYYGKDALELIEEAPEAKAYTFSMDIDDEYTWDTSEEEVTWGREPDNVNHPSHYGNGKIECIEYLEDFLNKDEFIGYLRGNIGKYMHRWRYKNGLEDLRKAEWYLKKLIEVMENE